MAGEALRLAIELHGQPGLRHGLRQRSLPADIDELLLATSGSSTRLGDLAAKLGLPVEEVLQAARFFVQELLLHPDADAYRVLGVARDSDQAVIKRHYRALQRWLHPDRLGKDSPESVYSARVNHAWDLLRTPARRQAFDVAADQVNHVEADAAMPVKVHVQRWERVENAAVRSMSPQLISTFLLFVLCVGLLWLALRDAPAPTLPDPSGAAQGAVEGLESLAAMLAGRADDPSPSADQPIREIVPTELPILVPVQAESSASAPPGPAPQSSNRSESPTLALSTPAATPNVQAVVADPISSPASGAPALAPTRAPTLVDPPASQPLSIISAEAATEVEAAAILLARHQEAQQQAGRLLAYVTGRNTPAPPIWRNLPAFESAERIRDDLTHGAVMRRAKVDTDHAQWVMKERTAALVVPIQPADRSDRPRLLKTNLVWHDGTWWVDTVTLVPER